MSKTLVEQIQEQIEHYLNSLQVSDWLGFEQHLADDLVYYTDRCVIHDRASFLHTMKASGWEGDPVRLENFSAITSDDATLAVARYKVNFKGRADGENMEFYAIETTILKHSDNSWKIVHTHASNSI